MSVPNTSVACNPMARRLPCDLSGELCTHVTMGLVGKLHLTPSQYMYMLFKAR